MPLDIEDGLIITDALNKGEKWTVVRKLGQGGEASVHEVINNKTGKTYAAKIGSRNSELAYEYLNLKKFVGVKGIQQVIANCVDTKIQVENGVEGLKFIVTDKYDQTLAQLSKEFGEFTLSCLCNIAIQLINILSSIHQRNLNFVDLSPANIMTSFDDKKQLYLIDFGCARETSYDKPKMCGTNLFGSTALSGDQVVSSFDDLESLGYVLAYLGKKALPWSQLVEKIQSASKKSKEQLLTDLLKKKQETKYETLFSGMDNVFVQYMKMLDKMRSNGKIDYIQLRALFEKRLKGIENPVLFDWLNESNVPKKDIIPVKIEIPISKPLKKPEKRFVYSKGFQVEEIDLTLNEPKPKAFKKPKTLPKSGKVIATIYPNRIQCPKW